MSKTFFDGGCGYNFVCVIYFKRRESNINCIKNVQHYWVHGVVNTSIFIDDLKDNMDTERVRRALTVRANMLTIFRLFRNVKWVFLLFVLEIYIKSKYSTQ